ncbi:hypothetical protein RchiOBHm_Chr5g0026321 [Rosa chinensis]|uniref:Uncharacterized protein n=1 Tax=Rosa chinensis TaxID=74649 RepID=A0A2P6Q8T4_ROSCH|nr:hypothetical protein RchiOBHm_Chr5g0026321 [Rosa chinensis]
MTSIEVNQFLKGLFKSKNDCLARFKGDFLLQLKEFSAQDNKDVYAEEAAAQRERRATDYAQ